MTFFLLFIFGLIIGSFLNVVSLRYAPGQKLLSVQIIGGRSHCLVCGKTLRFFELIPLLSFIWQRGKCRHCAHAISWQYPIVETVTALITAELPFFLYRYFQVSSLLASGASLFPFYLFTALWLLAAYAFIVTSVVDFRFTILPDQINVLLVILGLAIIFVKAIYSQIFIFGGSFLGPYAGFFGFSPTHFPYAINTLIALIVSTLVFTFIIGLTRGRGMGMGDLKISIPIALLLGWPDALLSLMASFIVGSIFGIALIALKLKKLKDGVPFGPFLALGVFIAIFYSEAIVRWYFSLI